MSRHGSRPNGRHGTRRPNARRPDRRRTDRDARRRELGQNFLVDPRALARVVDIAGVSCGDLVVDLGAGKGALTTPLRERGARVIAVERDPAWADALDRDHAGDPSVEVVRGDALHVDLPNEPFHVVANPPFGRTTDVLRRLLSSDAPLVDATLVLQLETARRVSGRPAAGAFSLSWAPWYELTVVDRIRRGAFRPVPSVDAAVLVVRPRAVPWLSPARYADWQGFVQRVFHASGRTAADRLDVALGSRTARRSTGSAGIDTVRPPSRLPVEAWLALFRALPDGAGGRGVSGPSAAP